MKNLFLFIAVIIGVCKIDAQISISPSNYRTHNYQSGEFDFEIYAGGIHWTYEWVVPAYVHLFRIENNLNISFDENESEEDLISKIVIKAEGYENDTITICQRTREPSDIKFVEGTSQLSVNDNIEIESSITNVGESNTGAFYVSYYLSVLPTIETKDLYKLGASKLIRKLNSGDTLDLSFSEEIDFFNEMIDEGYYYVVCAIDVEENVEETDEDHNVYVFHEKFFNEILCTDDFEPDNDFLLANDLDNRKVYQEIHCIGKSDKDFFSFSHSNNEYYFLVTDDSLSRGYNYLLTFEEDVENEMIFITAFVSEVALREKSGIRITLYDSDFNEIDASGKTSKGAFLSYQFLDNFPGGEDNTTSLKEIDFSEKGNVYEIYDLSGKIVKSEFDYLPNGIYFIRIKSNGNSVTKKVLKMNKNL